jgi:probable lipoprotein NlpC
MCGVTSCHSVRSTARGERHRPERIDRHGGRDDSDPIYQPSEQPQGSAKELIKYAKTWIGVPYRYGGNDRNGVDCSGFTCRVFNDAINVQLPRDSRSQAEFSKSISRSKLRPGDLVFFVNKQGGNRINHVALYIGNNQIIHSTTSRGVVISNLDDNYWSSHFYCCGRVL